MAHWPVFDKKMDAHRRWGDVPRGMVRAAGSVRPCPAPTLICSASSVEGTPPTHDVSPQRGGPERGGRLRRGPRAAHRGAAAALVCWSPCTAQLAASRPTLSPSHRCCSLRILPHDQNSGGFFIAVLRKTAMRSAGYDEIAATRGAAAGKEAASSDQPDDAATAGAAAPAEKRGRSKAREDKGEQGAEEQKDDAEGKKKSLEVCAAPANANSLRQPPRRDSFPHPSHVPGPDQARGAEAHAVVRSGAHSGGGLGACARLLPLQQRDPEAQGARAWVPCPVDPSLGLGRLLNLPPPSPSSAFAPTGARKPFSCSPTASRCARRPTTSFWTPQ